MARYLKMTAACAIASVIGLSALSTVARCDIVRYKEPGTQKARGKASKGKLEGSLISADDKDLIMMDAKGNIQRIPMTNVIAITTDTPMKVSWKGGSAVGKLSPKGRVLVITAVEDAAKGKKKPGASDKAPTTEVSLKDVTQIAAADEMDCVATKTTEYKGTVKSMTHGVLIIEQPDGTKKHVDADDIIKVSTREYMTVALKDKRKFNAVIAPIQNEDPKDKPQVDIDSIDPHDNLRVDWSDVKSISPLKDWTGSLDVKGNLVTGNNSSSLVGFVLDLTRDTGHDLVAVHYDYDRETSGKSGDRKFTANKFSGRVKYAFSSAKDYLVRIGGYD